MNKEDSNNSQNNQQPSSNDRVVIQTGKSAHNDDTISENIDSQVLAGTKRLRKESGASKDHSDASQKKRRSSGENS